MNIVITRERLMPVWYATTDSGFACSSQTLTDLMERLRSEILRVELRRNEEAP